MSSSPNSFDHAGRIEELDGWRAISTLLVIANHVGYQYANHLGHLPRIAEMLRNFGPLGVRVFFVISGFVICRLLILEEQRSGRVSLKGFYVRRAFRILPPFGLYMLAIGILLWLGLIVGSWRVFFVALFFLYDVRPLATHSWFVGQTWTLAVEEQFYLIFPALFLLARGTTRRFLFPIIFLMIAAWHVCAASFDWNWLTIPAVRAGFTCIACGVVMAIFERRARVIAKGLPAIVMAVIAIGLLWHPENYFSLSAAFDDSIYTPLGIALLLIFSVERKGPLSRFLRWKPVQAVGLTSYGIYLWQELFTAPRYEHASLGMRAVFFLPLLFAIVAFSWFFIEKPAMRVGRRLSKQVSRDRASEMAKI